MAHRGRAAGVPGAVRPWHHGTPNHPTWLIALPFLALLEVLDPTGTRMTWGKEQRKKPPAIHGMVNVGHHRCDSSLQAVPRLLPLWLVFGQLGIIPERPYRGGAGRVGLMRRGGKARGRPFRH